MQFRIQKMAREEGSRIRVGMEEINEISIYWNGFSGDWLK